MEEAEQDITKPDLNIIWLYCGCGGCVFELPGQLGHTWHSQNLLQIKQWHYRSWDDFWNQEATISIFPPVLLLLMLKHQILCPLSSPSPCTQSASLKLSSQNLSSHSLKSLSRASKMTCKWKKTSKSLWERVMQPQGLESSGVEGSVC